MLGVFYCSEKGQATWRGGHAGLPSKQWLGNQEAFSGDYHIVESEYIVRRLTPTECARLQGGHGGADGLQPHRRRGGRGQQ